MKLGRNEASQSVCRLRSGSGGSTARQSMAVVEPDSATAQQGLKALRLNFSRPPEPMGVEERPQVMLVRTIRACWCTQGPDRTHEPSCRETVPVRWLDDVTYLCYEGCICTDKLANRCWEAQLSSQFTLCNENSTFLYEKSCLYGQCCSWSRW